MHAALSKRQLNDTTLDPRAVKCVFIGFGISEGKKGALGYTIEKCSAYGIHTISYKVDRTFFPCRQKGEKRIVSLSGDSFSEADRREYIADFPIPPEYDQWEDGTSLQSSSHVLRTSRQSHSKSSKSE